MPHTHAIKENAQEICPQTNLIQTILTEMVSCNTELDQVESWYKLVEFLRYLLIPTVLQNSKSISLVRLLEIFVSSYIIKKKCLHTSKMQWQRINILISIDSNGYTTKKNLIKAKVPQGTWQTLNPTAQYLVSGAHDGIVLALRDKNSPTRPAMLPAVHRASLFWPLTWHLKYLGVFNFIAICSRSLTLPGMPDLVVLWIMVHDSISNSILFILCNKPSSTIWTECHFNSL